MACDNDLMITRASRPPGTDTRVAAMKGNGSRITNSPLLFVFYSINTRDKKQKGLKGQAQEKISSREP